MHQNVGRCGQAPPGNTRCREANGWHPDVVFHIPSALSAEAHTTRRVRALGILSWMAAGAAAFFAAMAQPKKVTFFDAFFAVSRKRTWDRPLLDGSVSLVVLTLALSAVGLWLNRKTSDAIDSPQNVSFIVLNVVSMAILGVYIMAITH